MSHPDDVTIEGDNERACRAAAAQHGLSQDKADSCNDGDRGCPSCPFINPKERAMLTTDEAAKRKWCPMVRMGTMIYGDAPDAPIAATNTDWQGARLQGSHNCIGGRCMMWREVPPFPGMTKELGYCGLAGRPMQSDRDA